MLRAILLVTGSLLALGLIYIFSVALLFPGMVTSSDKNSIYTASTIFLIGVFLSTILERLDKVDAAIYVYISALGATIIFSDSLTEILYGRSNMLLLFPIVLAGILLSSRMAYLVMFLISTLSVIGWYVDSGWEGQKLPNIPAILALIFLAFLIEWPISFLEKAMENLQKANKSLGKSEERYRRLMTALPVGVMVQSRGLVSYLNTAGAKMMGIENPKDAVGLPVLEFVHPDYQESANKRIQLLSSGEAVVPLEEKLVRMDGAAFDAEVSGLPLDYAEEPSTLAIFADITDRKKAQMELIQQNERLQEVSRQLLEVQEREKHTLAVELHDDLGQSLTSLKMMLELFVELPASEQRNTMEDASELIYELMGKVRNLSLDLRPAMLDDFGLFPALQGLFERLHAQMQIEVVAEFNLESEQRFDPQVEIAAFRIIQEALTNVARYASTKRAFVSIEAEDHLRIKVEDRGQGFDMENLLQKQALTGGISGMQERARLVGGTVSVFSKLDEGTRITAEIPLPNEKRL